MVTRQVNNRFGIMDYKGLSTDNKPTENVGVNALFLELDTGDFYYFDGTTWYKIGESGGGNASV